MQLRLAVHSVLPGEALHILQERFIRYCQGHHSVRGHIAGMLGSATDT
jgi:hypothetical protein